MAFCRVDCAACQHVFYRVEVRCEEYPAAYECPSCGSIQTTKMAVPPKADEKSAEENPCCHDEPTKKSSCDGCSASCDTC